ncbi:ATP-binding protein [Streptosporangium sp. CA-115845]|uniref:ATP-binding protein n=1 Tax=Streptosporangium sp. CA-115845 TaxID=3240071 RepID=UPI003D92F83B
MAKLDSGTTTGRDSGAAGRSDVRALVKVLRPGSASRRAHAILRDVLQHAGLPEDDIDTAELIVAELAANAEKHACPPYELRVFSLDGTPSWCEIVDGDPNTHEVRLILNLLHSVKEIGLPLLAENGRGLLLAHRLSRRQGTLWLTPDELTEMIDALRGVLASRTDNQPAPGRTPHLLGTILFPTEESGRRRGPG